MKALRSGSLAIALVSALLLSVAGVAEAGVISTAPLFIAAVGDAIGCEVANPTASSSVNITVTILDSAGAIEAGPLVIVGLAAGTSVQLDFTPVTSDRYHCNVDTNNAGVRVSLNRFSTTSGSVSDLNGYGQISRAGPKVTTAPLFIDDVGDAIGCEVVNVSPNPVNVQLDIFNSAATNVATAGPVALAAQNSVQLDFTPGAGEADRYRCDVTTPSSGVRVSLNRFSTTSGNVSDLNGYGEIR